MLVENNCISSWKVLSVNGEIWVCASLPGEKQTERDPKALSKVTAAGRYCT